MCGQITHFIFYWYLMKLVHQVSGNGSLFSSSCRAFPLFRTLWQKCYANWILILLKSKNREEKWETNRAEILYRCLAHYSQQLPFLSHLFLRFEWISFLEQPTFLFCVFTTMTYKRVSIFPHNAFHHSFICQPKMSSHICNNTWKTNHSFYAQCWKAFQGNVF